MTPTITVCFLIILFLLWLWIAYEIKNAPLLEDGEENNEIGCKNDEYEKQIQYLRENPGEIGNHWSIGKGIFRAIHDFEDDTLTTGCLTQIRRYNLKIYSTKNEIDWEMTKLIKEETKIPMYVNEIGISSLSTFAHYQRILDKRYNRKPFIFTK